MSQVQRSDIPIAARPLLWLVSVPDLDPPANEAAKRAPLTLVGPDQLAMEFTIPGALPETLGATLFSVPDPIPEAAPEAAPGRASVEDDSFFAVQRSHTSELAEPVEWTGRLVQAIVEVLAGERPAQQLTRWLTPEIHAAVVAHSRATNQVGVEVRRHRSRRRVGSIRVTAPADGVVEASAVVLGSRRSRAIALRLEGLDGRWRCTALEVG